MSAFVVSCNAGLITHDVKNKQHRLAAELAQAESFTVNTSNPSKLAEFRDFLGRPVQSQSADLPEPNTDELTVIRYKASQFDGVLVDDTSLEVEGEEVGVNVRWLLNDLPRFAGKKAIFRCLVGINQQGAILIYRGEVRGTIVPARGKGFGFNPVFLPDGTDKTLGEEIPRPFNARFLALQKLLAGQADHIMEPLMTWDGAFQHDD